MPAQWTERTLPVSPLESDESVWRGASRAAEVEPRCDLRKQDHAASLGDAGQARCPRLNTSASEALHPIPENVRGRHTGHEPADVCVTLKSLQ
jgi:hypothetical protein